MKFRQWIVLGALLLLVALAGIAVLATWNGEVSQTAVATAQTALVDQRPLRTARALAPLALSSDEKHLAEEAARIADHEVDLAFSDALREATEHPAGQDPKHRDLYLRIQAAQKTLAEEQSRMVKLKAKLDAAKPAEKEDMQEQIDLLDAQQALDEDELEDARQDMIRAGGDPEGKIQRLRAEHEAGHEVPASSGASQAPSVDLQTGNLAGQVRAWMGLREKQAILDSARREAQDLGQQLLAEHETLERRVRKEESQKVETRQQAEDIRNAAAQGAHSKQATASTVSSLKHYSNDQRLLSDFDKRIQDQQELGDIYGNWLSLAAIQQRGVLLNILRSGLWILLIILLVYLGNRTSDHLLRDTGPERKHFTLRTVLRFALQAVGVLLIAFVILGTPNQMPTILGLAGAGLTVALKDFIVGFFGWFVLMGRNGIRVGDWVEINGVVGEVVEIGVLRTVLLETGNWTDTGHPTGRKVAFVNSFAIEGHFFNFSTSGQWLWDELLVTIPEGKSPYELVDAIQKLVEEETWANASLAEQEWQKSTSRYRLQSLSVAPAIHLRPIGGGVELQVRYITSAQERYVMRSRMYEKIVGLMHGETKGQVAVGPGPQS